MTTGRQTGLRSEAQRAGLRKLPGETVGARKPLHAATREEHSIKRMQWLLLSTLTTAIAKSGKVRGKADPKCRRRCCGRRASSPAAHERAPLRVCTHCPWRTGSVAGYLAVHWPPWPCRLYVLLSHSHPHCRWHKLQRRNVNPQPSTLNPQH